MIKRLLQAIRTGPTAIQGEPPTLAEEDDASRPQEQRKKTRAQTKKQPRRKRKSSASSITAQEAVAASAEEVRHLRIELNRCRNRNLHDTAKIIAAKNREFLEKNKWVISEARQRGVNSNAVAHIDSLVKRVVDLNNKLVDAKQHLGRFYWPGKTYCEVKTICI